MDWKAEALALNPLLLKTPEAGDPQVVTPRDKDAAAPEGGWARLADTGQSCHSHPLSPSLYVKGFFAFMPGTPLKLEEGVRVWNWGYGEL